jgi:hypothetical protein
LSRSSIDVIARVSSHLSHRIATTFIDSDAALAADTVHLGTFGFCYQAFDQCSISSNGCCSPLSVRSRRVLYESTIQTVMRFTLRGSDSKWRYKKFGKRAACEMGASELITFVPYIYPIASDIEVSTLIDPIPVLYATFGGRGPAESVMSSIINRLALCKQKGLVDPKFEES